MDKLRCYENESGFYIDYIFQDKNFRKCLRISEDNDYFAFCLFSPSIKSVVGYSSLNFSTSSL